MSLPERPPAFSGLAIGDTTAMTCLSSLFHPASILVAIGFACASVPGGCVEQKKTESAKPVEPTGAATEARQFCTNNMAIAGDARIAWQTSKLLELEAQIKQRLADLEARKVQLVEWLQKHDEAMKKATDDVIAMAMSRLMLKSAKRASLIENLRSLRGLGKMRVR